jgi:hypothetical protein
MSNRNWPHARAAYNMKTPPGRCASDLPVEVVQLLKIGYATIYEHASPPAGGSRGTSGEGEHVTARKFDV